MRSLCFSAKSSEFFVISFLAVSSLASSSPIYQYTIMINQSSQVWCHSSTFDKSFCQYSFVMTLCILTFQFLFCSIHVFHLLFHTCNSPRVSMLCLILQAVGFSQNMETELEIGDHSHESTSISVTPLLRPAVDCLVLLYESSNLRQLPSFISELTPLKVI